MATNIIYLNSSKTEELLKVFTDGLIPEAFVIKKKYVEVDGTMYYKIVVQET